MLFLLEIFDKRKITYYTKEKPAFIQILSKIIGRMQSFHSKLFSFISYLSDTINICSAFAYAI